MCTDGKRGSDRCDDLKNRAKARYVRTGKETD